MSSCTMIPWLHKILWFRFNFINIYLQCTLSWHTVVAWSSSASSACPACPHAPCSLPPDPSSPHPPIPKPQSLAQFGRCFVCSLAAFALWCILVWRLNFLCFCAALFGVQSLFGRRLASAWVLVRVSVCTTEYLSECVCIGI